ncbi:hypothetical protein, partial [Xanthomonas oryzae]
LLFQIQATQRVRHVGVTQTKESPGKPGRFTRQSGIPLLPINTATPTPRACVSQDHRIAHTLVSRCRSLIWHVCRIPPEQHP